MLAIFQKQVAHAPQELNSPRAAATKPRNPDEILRDFHAVHPTDAISTSFGGGAALACVGSNTSPGGYPRMFCGLDDIYCVFLGRLDNLSGLIRQYGLCGRSTNEALLVIEAYRTLRDRGPYPADQVVKDLAGAFAFVVFDNRSGAVFAALGGNDGAGAGASVPLYWGVAADGSAVISDDRDVVKRGCGKSYAPFPAGCMFHSEGGLKSFEHPMNRLKAMPRVDSEGAMCGATFKVDTFTKINSMPRVGSATNWAAWDDAAI